MATGPGTTCYICDLLRQEPASTMVWYDKVKRWLCLRCHLAERKLQKFKGKGTVQRIFQKCDVCKDGSLLQNENMASWFCYDCRHYLCKLCVKSKEQCPVSYPYFDLTHWLFIIKGCWTSSGIVCVLDCM